MSGIAILYKNGFTRNKRPINHSAFLGFEIYSSNKGTSKRVVTDGCFVSNGTGYFDFTINANDVALLYDYSYAYVGGVGSYGNGYCVFIDRIEINNFSTNETKNGEIPTYYRAYFTVDWWTTILADKALKNESFNPQIRGEVERAHVNDIVKVGSVYRVNKDYISNIPEETLLKTQSFSFNLIDYVAPPLAGNSTTAFHLKFLYIFKVIDDKDNLPTLIGADAIEVFDLKYKASYVLGVLPINTENLTVPWFSFGTEETAPIYGGFDISEITDDQIITMFVSDIPPNIEINSVQHGIVRLVAFDNTNNKMHLNIGIGDTVQNCLCPIITSTTQQEVSLYNYFEDRNIVVYDRDTELELYNNYNDYLAKGVVKAHTSAYKKISVSVLDKGFIYIQEWGRSVLTANIEPSSGGVIIHSDEQQYNGLSQYIIIDSVKKFEPAVYKDSLKDMKNAVLDSQTAAKGFEFLNGMTKGTLNAGVQYFSGNPVGAIASTVNTVVDTTKQAFEFYATSASNDIEKLKLARGNKGTIANEPSLSMCGLSNLRCTVVEPTPFAFNELTRRLALYGYNTHLEVNEILANHKRQRFNFIKTKNCYIEDGLITEALNDIRNMFNNGVFLYSAQCFETDVVNPFDTEVVNYPISIL